ncbi:putative selenate reductase subunit YgfK [Endozoicomonas atrinae]|uniref:putative selenate reductase subunit YgfK n=1 Tax=Endozoicomonas atrinae TaxID=1333660 RepID=UPI00082517C8|nr:putative selenate reductase subunit YgfK [Endozoicomonas atrinae]
MGDIMRPVPLREMLDRIHGEYKSSQSLFGIRADLLFRKKNDQNIKVCSETASTAVGPAAGPHTQLAQNIIASWAAGGRFIELKTVQIMDTLEIEKPCIDPEDECYNTEWSTEFTLPKAYDEYLKAWVVLHVLEEMFDPAMGSGREKSFIFNMSVGYDLKGIKTVPMQTFIDNMMDSSGHEKFAQYQDIAREWLKSEAVQETFQCKDRVDSLLATVDRISGKIARSVTLSTMHGCPPHEIEAICHYMMTEKHIDTYVKLNPTLLGFAYVRKVLDDRGFGYIGLKEESFSHDLQMEDAIPMLHRLRKTGADLGLSFGVKLSNTLGCVNNRGRLPGDEMYMSGRSLYPLTINLAAVIAREFDGQMPMSYSGGAWKGNVADIFNTGIRPITMATEMLKPGGYMRLRDCALALEECDSWARETVDVAALETLAAKALTADEYTEKNWHETPVRQKATSPLTDCTIAPCKQACPIGQDAPEYIQLVANGEYQQALSLIYDKNPLPGITGHICDHQCMFSCSRKDYEGAVRIRDMKRIAMEKGWDDYKAAWQKPAQEQTARCAVIGAGPAGLSAAYFMARAGFPVVVFEKERDAGGIIRNVLPNFRIPAEVIQQDIDFVRAHGVQFEFGCDPKLDVLDLKHSGFDYVFLGIGAEKGNRMPLEGDRSRLLPSLQFLRQFNEAPETIKLGKRVVVVGGGNTAMDSARAALKVPGVEEVRVFYRRTEEEMPADREEYGNAVKDGARFQFLTNPESMTEEGMLTCRIMKLGEPDASGRRRPVATEETCTLPVDTIITAIGEQADSELLNKMGIPLGTDGWAAVDRQTKETGVSNVFLIGDAHTGPSTVVRCIDEARRATDTAIARNQALVHHSFEYKSTEVPVADEKVIRARRGLIPMSSVPADDVEAFARQEGERCLECNHICNKCVDVCPNRANVAVEIPGFKEKYQILHLDAYCNECGNCAQFCNWESKPYKEKFTVFSLMEDFENSTNSGFLVQDDMVWLRSAGSDGKERVNKMSINVMGELSEIPRGQDDLCRIISHVYLNNAYLLGKVYP